MVQAPSTTLTPDDDGAVHVRTSVAGPGPVRFTFEVSDGSSLDVARDGSVAVLDPDGGLRAGLAAPVVTDADGQTLRARWSTPESDGADGADATDDAGSPLVLDLTTTDRRGSAAEAYPLALEVYLGREVVSSVEWGTREGGRSLAVTPTAWGRESGSTGRTYGWDDVVRLEPDADTTVMRNQFLCHVDGARQKDTWNLEPWRPEISFIGYLLARCNPT